MTDAELDQLRGVEVLRAIIADRVELKRDGRRWKGCCPFHSEKTASFKVFPDGKFKCFGCGAHGDVFDYVQRRDGVDFPQAADIVASAWGIIPKPKNGTCKYRDREWFPMVPPPPEAPKPDARLLGRIWFDYVDQHGKLLFYQRRFEKADGKSFAQLTYGTLIKNGSSVIGWHPKGPPQPFPLYRLDRLMKADPNSEVIVVEGEGKCQAAERMFPDKIVASWLNGANSVLLSDWSPLRRFSEQNIIWWPDADKPREDGTLHGCFVATPAFRKLFPRARSVDTTGLEQVKDGFDAADLEHDCRDDPDAWLQARLRVPERPQPGRILTGADFIARHVPPVWLIDGIVQRSRLYACTSLTGHGKTAVWLFNACMIHAGRMIGQLDVFQGNVLFLAGENPADLEARMIGMARAFNLPLNRLPYVLPGSFPLTEEEADALKRDIAGLGVPLALIVGDTASSFFPGDDENSNVQAGTYARTLRALNECDGNPAIMALCHPTKGASRSNLLPRGGGAFLNELDGNLVLWSHEPGRSHRIALVRQDTRPRLLAARLPATHSPHRTDRREGSA